MTLTKMLVVQISECEFYTIDKIFISQISLVGSYALVGSTQVVFFPTLSVYIQLLPIWDLWEIEFT